MLKKRFLFLIQILCAYIFYQVQEKNAQNLVLYRRVRLLPEHEDRHF